MSKTYCILKITAGYDTYRDKQQLGCTFQMFVPNRFLPWESAGALCTGITRTSPCQNKCNGPFTLSSITSWNLSALYGLSFTVRRWRCSTCSLLQSVSQWVYRSDLRHLLDQICTRKKRWSCEFRPGSSSSLKLHHRLHLPARKKENLKESDHRAWTKWGSCVKCSW